MDTLKVALEGLRLVFYCPGCKSHHGISLAPGRWTFDGNFVSPTINPSVLSYYEDENNQRVTTCHLFIRAGRIEFLSDCKHELAGKTVDMDPIEW